MKKNKEFETERIKLVKPNLKYLEEFFIYASKPNIGPMAGWMPHKNITESKFILEEMMKNDYTWIITTKDDKFIGTIDLRPTEWYQLFRPQAYELGYSIDDTYWGQGITVEAANLLLDYAFNELKIKEIEVSHADHNHQSRRVIEKLGFRFLKSEYQEKYRNYALSMSLYKMTKYDYDRRDKIWVH